MSTDREILEQFQQILVDHLAVIPPPPPPLEPECGSVKLSKTSFYAGAGEANWVVTITPEDASCIWSAHSPLSWVKLWPEPLFHLRGVREIRVQCLPNTTGSFRTGTINLGGIDVEIKQEQSASPVPVEPPPPPPPDVIIPGGTTIRVKPGDDINAAIQSLEKTGGTIIAYPGEYQGHFKAPIRTDKNLPITIKSDTVNIPGEGERITEEFEPGIAMFHATNNADGNFFAPNKSSGVYFVGVGFGPSLYDRTMAGIGDGKQFMLTPDDRPSDFLFDRVLFRGHPENGQHQGVRLNGKDIRIINSWFKDIFEQGRDSQCCGGWNGTEGILIENNHMEAGAENIMFGGSDSAGPDMEPRNVIIRGNHLLKHARWMQLAKQPSIKCLFELKSCKVLVFEKNLLEGCWARDWPDGVAIVIKSANQEGGCPWVATEDVVIQDNFIRNVGQFFCYVGKNDSSQISDWQRRTTLRNNVVLEMAQGEYKGTGKAYRICDPSEDLRIENNTLVNGYHSFIEIWKDVPPNGKRFKFNNNIVSEGDYGIMGEVGLGMSNLPFFFPGGYEFLGNVIRDDGAREIPYPSGNAMVEPSAFGASFEANGKLKPGSAIATASTGLTTNGKVAGADVDQVIAGLNDKP